MRESAELKSYKESLLDPSLEGEAVSGRWLADLRRKAYARFKMLGFPTRRLEGWKYIDLEPLLGAYFVSPEKEALKNISREAAQNYFISPNEKNRLLFVNGVYSKELSSGNDIPEGVILENLATALEKRAELLKPSLGREVDVEANTFAAVNAFSFRDGVFLYIPDKVVVNSPIHVLFLNTGCPATKTSAGSSFGEETAPVVFYPRILIVAGTNTRVRFTVNIVSLNDSKYLMDMASEVYLKAGACVEFDEVYRGRQGSNRLSSHHFYLKKHSNLELFSFSTGGSVSRSESVVEFEEENAFASLKGLSLLDGDSQSYTHLTTRHRVPHGTSRQFFKNILAGNSRSEFNSQVEVSHGAVKTDSQQLNRNLLLSDAARSYSRPQLRIHADDVSCVHGSSTGQIQKDELFYLRTRGLSKELARFILTYGFAREILEMLSSGEHLRAELETLTRQEIEGMMGEVK